MEPHLFASTELPSTGKAVAPTAPAPMRLFIGIKIESEIARELARIARPIETHNGPAHPHSRRYSSDARRALARDGCRSRHSQIALRWNPSPASISPSSVTYGPIRTG